MVYRITKSNGERIPVIDDNRNLRVDVLRSPIHAGREIRPAVDFTTLGIGQGTSAGFTSGGRFSASPYVPNSYASNNTIDKFPFAATFSYTDVGDLTQDRYGASGASDAVGGYGYTAGGMDSPTPPTGPYDAFNIIDRFPFTSNANAADVGDLDVTKYLAAGAESPTHGFHAGGYDITPPTGTETSTRNTRSRHAFASSANATDFGDLTPSFSYGTANGAGCTDKIGGRGFVMGGRLRQPSPPNNVFRNDIYSYPFANSSTGSDVGTLINGDQRSDAFAFASGVNGYIAGGIDPTASPYQGPDREIQKFPFAISSANAAEVGELNYDAYASASMNSATAGYCVAGRGSPFTTMALKRITKVDFATDADTIFTYGYPHYRSRATGFQG